ncbi:MAG TPA: hypothetical protein VK184_11510 [Nostocaceae cyanobacterium]|nr:hypothetical protein [Nostocaceae cyanobacterium]
MIEPISAAVTALATILSTKALEKVGENIGDTLSNKVQQFLASLKKQAPATVTAIEQAPAQPLDYGQAVLDIETAAKADPTVNQAMQELTAAATAETNPQLAESINKLTEALKSQIQQPSVINNQKLAEEIKNLFQGNTFNAPVTFN